MKFKLEGLLRGDYQSRMNGYAIGRQNGWMSEMCIRDSRYPKGARVELVRMDDPQAPPVGTKGTVLGVDDVGSILVAWDNGSGLNVAFGEDICRLVERCAND